MLNGTVPGSIGQLRFPQLDWLEMYYSPSFSNVWTAFFKNHQNLTKLDLVQGFTKNFKTPEGSVQLVELTSDLLNLVEVTVHYSSLVSAGTIIRFIQAHRKLMKVQFSIAPDRTFDDFEIQILRKRFELEWHIRIFYDEQGCYMIPELIIERKNSTLSL